MQQLLEYMYEHIAGLDWCEMKDPGVVTFFDATYKKTPDVKEFVKLVDAAFKNSGIDPLDNLTRSYPELGAYMGHQQHALVFMGISENLGLCEVSTPHLRMIEKMNGAVLGAVSEGGYLSEDQVKKIKTEVVNKLENLLVAKQEMANGELFFIPDQKKIKAAREPKSLIEQKGSPNNQKLLGDEGIDI